jgi:hypothetical protein
MNRWRVASLLLSISLGGCVVSDVTLLTPNHQPYPAVPESSVRVFLDEQEIPGPFERVALLSTHGDAGLTNVGQSIESARKKAASIGANGIVVGSISEPSLGESLGAKSVSPLLSGDRRGSVMAVRYRSGSAVAAPSSSTNTQQNPQKLAAPPAPAAASPTPTPASAGATIKPGFRDLRWGDAPTAEMKPLGRWTNWSGTYTDLESFERPGDELHVASVAIFNLVYGFRAGRLAAVKFKIDPAQMQAMLNALSRTWGEPRHATPADREYWLWTSSSSIAALAKKTSGDEVGVVLLDRKYAQAVDERKSGL